MVPTSNSRNSVSVYERSGGGWVNVYAGGPSAGGKRRSSCAAASETLAAIATKAQTTFSMNCIKHALPREKRSPEFDEGKPHRIYRHAGPARRSICETRA